MPGGLGVTLFSVVFSDFNNGFALPLFGLILFFGDPVRENEAIKRFTASLPPTVFPLTIPGCWFLRPVFLTQGADAHGRVAADSWEEVTFQLRSEGDLRMRQPCHQFIFHKIGR